MRFDLESSLPVLERTPEVLAILLHDLSDVWIHTTEGEGTWSPFEVLGHLVHGERTDWIPRARRILEQGESVPFEPFDRFAMFTESKGKTLGNLLDEFRAVRAGNLEILRGWNLQAADLARRGQHPDFGAVTLGQLLATWVVHDLGHVAQVTRVMSKQYADAVGPWKAYLPVLGR